MPLKEGSGRDTIWSNARILMHEGYPEDQAFAIAYRKAGKTRKKKGKRAKRP